MENRYSSRRLGRAEQPYLHPRGVSRMRKVIYMVFWLALMAVLLFSVTHTALS
jgi:hypothetical protein